MTNRTTKIKSASGDTLQIIGQARDVKLKIGADEITINPYIVQGSQKYTIIGVHEVLKHPQLVTNILTKEGNKKEKFQTIASITNTRENLFLKI